MKEIEDRKDVYLLISSFYKAIRKDTVLGPIFNHHIPEDHWPDHLNKLTDFWMTNLFGVPCFKGNPTQAHINVDKNLNYTIDQKHFGQWINLWFTTIDSLFEGTLANKAKNAAKRMAMGQYLAIWHHRPEESKNQNFNKN